MNITINAVKFRLAEKLEEFINEKVAKLEKHLPDCIGAEITLKVDKPSSDYNKIVDIKLQIRGADLFATKQADSFEEAVQECIDALKTQIDKHKDKR